MADFIIAHMYPDLMNLYGDRGNLLCLKQRLAWYEHNCIIKTVTLGDKIDYNHIDMLFMGGGSDREQGLVYRDLAIKAEELKTEIDGDLPVLCICGAYQLLGRSYVSFDGTIMEGLGLVNFITRGSQERLIGNILINSIITGESLSVVGFENHGGRTYFEDSDLKPFGTVIRGYGNNGEDKTEGIAYHNLIGTYLHGPLLPKNPGIADFFIKAMASRKSENISIELDDDIENYAHNQIKNRLLGK